MLQVQQFGMRQRVQRQHTSSKDRQETRALTGRL
jgi:hypothetical protein